MVTLIFVVKCRDDMKREAALAYWRDCHGPMARALPGLVRYVQYHFASDAQPFDGVAELEFATKADLKLAIESPEWASIGADMTNFAALDAGGGGECVVHRIV